MSCAPLKAPCDALRLTCVDIVPICMYIIAAVNMHDFENDRVELLKNVLGALLLPNPAHMRRTQSRIGAMCSLIW